MANLTALMVARDQKLPSQQDRLKGVIYVSAQTHLSVAKGLRVLGFIDSQIRKIPSDSSFQMEMNSLRGAVEVDREAGLLPFAIVASCGTTNTGSIDPLNAIAILRKERRCGCMLTEHTVLLSCCPIHTLISPMDLVVPIASHGTRINGCSKLTAKKIERYLTT